MARVTEAVKSAAAALTAVRQGLLAELADAEGAIQVAGLSLTMAQVDAGHVLNRLQETFCDEDKSNSQNAADYVEYLKLHVPSIPYSTAKKYQQAARTADAIPGAAEAVNGSIMSLQYLNRFEADHAADIIADAGPDATLPMLKESATRVVPSLKPDPEKQQKKERDAAARKLEATCEGIASSVKKVLGVEAKYPAIAAVIREAYFEGMLTGGNNGPMSKTAAQKLMRAADSVKKQQNEAALDRANQKKNRVQG